MAALEPFTLALHERENAMADEVVATWIGTAEQTPTLDVLPPGVDASTWAELVAKFKAILGDDGVLTGHGHRVRYHDPYAEHQDEREQEKRASSATLYPVTVEHIQAILKLCNEHKIPVWTVSRGKNLGYGGPAARVKVRVAPLCSCCIAPSFTSMASTRVPGPQHPSIHPSSILPSHVSISCIHSTLPIHADLGTYLASS